LYLDGEAIETDQLVTDDEEEYEDEEDEEFDEEDEVGEDDGNVNNNSNTIQATIPLDGAQITTTADGQQVVVLEVIQVQGPDGEQQAVAVLTSNPIDMMGSTGGNTITTTALSSSQLTTLTSLNGQPIPQTITLAINGPPTQGLVDTKPITRSSKAVTNAEENVENGDIEGVGFRTRRRTEEKGGKKRKLSIKGNKGGVAEAGDSILPGIPDPAELARRQEEETQRQLEQKQRDMEDCFGFKEDVESDMEGEEPESPPPHIADQSSLHLLGGVAEDEDD